MICGRVRQVSNGRLESASFSILNRKNARQSAVFFRPPGSMVNRRTIGNLHFWINNLKMARPDVVVLPFWVHGVMGYSFSEYPARSHLKPHLRYVGDITV